MNIKQDFSLLVRNMSHGKYMFIPVRKKKKKNTI